MLEKIGILIDNQDEYGGGFLALVTINGTSHPAARLATREEAEALKNGFNLGVRAVAQLLQEIRP